LPNSIKVAVVMSHQKSPIQSFEIRDALSDKIVLRSAKVKPSGQFGNFAATYRLDFSNLQKNGIYYIQTTDSQSPKFKISEDVYAGSADFLLKYMRQQRCGYNPFLKDSCHVHDGFRVYHPDPEKDSTFIDVKGGWHDASDYLQYTTTTANAVYQMLLAYKSNPSAFKDLYDTRGLEGPNGIPDIIDEIKWGIDWLMKMNPAYGEMYNQIADDVTIKDYDYPTTTLPLTVKVKCGQYIFAQVNHREHFNTKVEQRVLHLLQENMLRPSP